MSANLRRMIDTINKSDKQQVQCQYDIANTLCAIADHQLYEQDGYVSFRAMVHEELTIAVSTALCYVSFHRHVSRLRYNKTETLNIMQHHHWRQIEKVIKHSDRKMGLRALKNAIEASREERIQFNFNMGDRSNEAVINHALQEHGMEITQSGSRTGMTEALMHLIEDYNRLKGGSTKGLVKAMSDARRKQKAA